MRRRTVEESDDNGKNQCKPSAVGLEWSTEWEFAAVDALCLHATPEAHIRKENIDPVQSAKDSDEADKVAKHGGSRLGHVHVCQSAEERGRNDAVNGNAACCRLEEDLGSMAVFGKRVEGASADVNICIGCTDHKDKQTSIDDIRKDADTANDHGDHERRRSSTRLGLSSTDEPVAVVGNGHAEKQNTNDVEQSNAPQSLADGLGDVLARVWGLGKGSSNDFSARVGEAGLHHASPKSKEFPKGSHFQVFGKGTGVVPVGEANTVVRRPTAEGNDQTDNHDSD